MSEIVNRVALSPILTIDLEKFLSNQAIFEIDIKQFLFKEYVLREDDFRKAVKQIDWSDKADKVIAIFCSNDAIIPQWAYMLIASAANSATQNVYVGNAQQVSEQILLQNISQINPLEYTNKPVVIKGCGNTPIPNSAYVAITNKLQSEVKSLMFGEACSTVPIYKKLKK